MAVWADNIKFVKDIIDSKFIKIDQAVAEVIVERVWLLKVERCGRTCRSHSNQFSKNMENTKRDYFRSRRAWRH